MNYYLTPEQVLFIHSRLVCEAGGAHGLQALAMLLSSLGRPQVTFNGTYLFYKAASLMYSLIRNHPFVDGNKRTGIAATGLLLNLNGYDLIVENDEMVRSTLSCARSEPALDEISSWLQRYCVEK